jgi:pilus assembly protein CpaB
MRARTLLLLLFAVLLAGGTAFLARTYLATQRTEAEIKAAPLALATPSKSVLVAHADIKRGQILRPEDTSWQIWPEGALDKNYVVLGGPPNPPRTPESFAGYVARDPIPAGEPITDTRVVAPGNRGFLAAVLRPGMRAISVPVTITSGISGFIFPGDQVDLLLTYTVTATASGSEAGEASKEREHKVAETMLRDIRVIGIDQRLESKAGEVLPAHTATFEVTPKQSEVIALASKIGEVSLSLRSLVPAEQAVAEQTHQSSSGALGKVGGLLFGPPAADRTAAEAANESDPASSVGATATYTLDNEITARLTRLGRRSAAPNGAPSEAPSAAAVTILRGGGKGGESTPSSTSAKGS